MDITYYKVEKDAIIQASSEINPEDWSNKLDWINIRCKNRKELADYFRKLSLYDEDVCACLEHPENSPFSNTFKKDIIVNLSISNTNDIYSTEYISVIIENNLVITITPHNNDLFNERNLSTYSVNKYPTIKYFLLNVMTIKLLAQGNVNISIARNRLQLIEDKLTGDPEKLSSNGLMSCERDISQLSDIIEDQYIGFGILASLSTVNQKQESTSHLNSVIKGFEPLDKAILRLGKKAESLRLQYMLLQQEKSTRKINVLTIIQAIFVPLTFIAGVYGMNFVVMPELNWTFGYLLVWIVFVGMASGLLVYFYRKGWFD